MTPHTTHDAPSLALLALEPLRALFEFAHGKLAPRHELPRGDGHPVIVYPGLATNGLATAHLRTALEELGHATYDWEHGLNRGPQDELDAWLEQLSEQLHALTDLHGEPASLVGWSLGGIYARELAKRFPDQVRQVVTLGTPFAGSPASTNAGKLFALLNGQEVVVDETLLARLREAPPVPTTSIYSRTDGVVAWQGCVQPNGRKRESIEVPASHLGLIAHPQVLHILADRLAQPAGRWKRYDR